MSGAMWPRRGAQGPRQSICPSWETAPLEHLSTSLDLGSLGPGHLSDNALLGAQSSLSGLAPGDPGSSGCN